MQQAAPGLFNLLHGVVGGRFWGVPPVLLLVPVPDGAPRGQTPQLRGAMRELAGGAVPAVALLKVLAQSRLREGAFNGLHGCGMLQGTG